MSSGGGACRYMVRMSADPARPVVHLELHTADLPRACAFYAEVCGWRPERVQAGGNAYWTLGLGGSVTGGAVDCPTPRPLWLPYVEVPEIVAVTEHAQRLGARLLLPPREGPAGWRSVVSAPAGGEIAFWQQKR